MLATTAKEHPFEWESHLKKVCFAYNTSVHASTGHTPFFLMFGRQAQLPVGLLYRTDKTERVTSFEYAFDLKQSLEKAYERVRTTTGAKQLLQMWLYNRRVHGEPYQVGDQVWLHTTVLAHGNTKKLHHPWTGPYRVVKRISDSTYRIQLHSNPRKRTVVHFDRLKLCPRDHAMGTDASATTSTSPANNRTIEDVPRSAPIGARLEIVEPMNSHVEQQPSSSQPPVPILPERRYPTQTTARLLWQPHLCLRPSCRIRDVFLQRGELCNTALLTSV